MLNKRLIFTTNQVTCCQSTCHYYKFNTDNLTDKHNQYYIFDCVCCVSMCAKFS